MPQLLHLDVSDLEPPEPMAMILQSIQSLDPDAALRVQHRRQPFPLYQMLDDMGYAHLCVERNTKDFVIFIWPQQDDSLANYCRQAAAAEHGQ